MFWTVCIRYLEIAKTQVKLSLRVNLLLAAALIVITPFVFGISNLDAAASNFVLERFIPLTGIILLAPAFFPEQDKSIAELVESKYTSHIKIYLIRFILAVGSLFLLTCGFIIFMLLTSCEFNAGEYILGTFANAFFLGALGFGAHALSDNIVAGYLLPLGYYLFNMFNGDKLGNFYLFSLTAGSLTEKYWLLGVGVIFIIMGLAYKYIRIKIR